MENRLIEVIDKDITTTLTYDSDGGRIKKEVTNSEGHKLTSIYIGKLFEKQRIADSVERIVKHIYLGSQRIASITTQYAIRRTQCYHHNHLGSTSLITDSQGKQIASYDYTFYGNLSKRNTHNAIRNTNYYNSKELDETGLYYYGARYYDSQIARFIQPDTIIQAPYDSQSLNRYTYCRNNPVNLIDPTGNFWWVIGAAIGALIGGLSAHFTGGNIWQGIGLGALTGGLSFGTIASSAPALLKLSSGLGFISFVSSRIPDPAFQDIAQYTGYASLGLAGIYMIGEMWKGIKYWLNEPKAGLYTAKGEPVIEISSIPPKSRIAVTGIFNKELSDAEALAKFFKADYVFFNPSRGPIADFVESILEWVFHTGSVDRQLANILSQLKNPVVLLPHSQGTIIAANALLKLALSGKSLPGGSVVWYNALAVNQTIAFPAAWLAGVKWSNIHYQIKLFDPIAIPALSLNPIELFTGAIGLGFFGFGIKFHGAGNYG